MQLTVLVAVMVRREAERMDESQSLSSVHTQLTRAVVPAPYLPFCPCKPLQARVPARWQRGLRPRPPKPQPLLSTEPTATRFTISTSTRPGTHPFRALSNPSADHQKKAAKAKMLLSALKGLGASTVEWELEVFRACGRTGGVGRKVCLN